MKILFSILLLALNVSNASETKSDVIQKIVKNKCNKEILKENSLSAVLAAYDCRSGKDVEINNCKIKCLQLKQNMIAKNK